MTSEVSAKEFGDNSIIDSEIVEESEEIAVVEEEEEEEEESTSNGTTISEQNVVDITTAAPPPPPQKPNENSTGELTENYSEEFETEDVEEDDDVAEEVNESDDSSDVENGTVSSQSSVAAAAAVEASKLTDSSSSSIRIRCEINISNSALRSDDQGDEVQALLASDDEDRTTTVETRGSSGRSSHNSISSQANKQQNETPPPLPENHFTMDDEIRSWTPSDYNEDSHLFDMSILHESMVNLLLMEDRKMQHDRQLHLHHQQQQRMRYKNGTRLSLSFTNERMREIERHNQILVRKIFQQSASPQVTVSSRRRRREDVFQSLISVFVICSFVHSLTVGPLNPEAAVPKGGGGGGGREGAAKSVSGAEGVKLGGEPEETAATNRIR